MAGQRITAAEVGVADTIGILRQPWIRPRRTSAGHGWSGLYLSTRSEQPYHASFEPARTHLVVLHLDGPVKLEYGSGGSIERKSVPAGGFVLHPAGRDLDIALGGDLNTIHAYLAAEQVDEAAGGGRAELVAGLGPNDPMIEQLLLAMDGVLKEQVPTDRTYVDHLTAMLAAHLVYRYDAARGSIARVLGAAGQQLTNRHQPLAGGPRLSPVSVAHPIQQHRRLRGRPRGEIRFEHMFDYSVRH